MKVYLDTNVFVNACALEAPGDDCRKILDSLVKGKFRAITSYLTFDELFFALKSLKGYEAAVVFSENFLEMPNLQLASVNPEIIEEAFKLIKQFRLPPRDAIHAATAKIQKSDVLVSDDKDLSHLKGISCRTVNDFLKSGW